jgi:hypothetical protein
MARVPRDGCLVPAEPFAEIIRDFVATWNKERPQPGGQFGLDEPPPIRPLAWLAAASSDDDFAVTEGVIEGLLEQGERRRFYVELRIADRIATALDQPYIFSDERIEGHIVPNPAATKAAQTACRCGGSEQHQLAAA